MIKEFLALAWHAADSALDAFDAPRPVRLGVALIGLGWSVWWFTDKLTQPVALVTCDAEIAIRPRTILYTPAPKDPLT